MISTLTSAGQLAIVIVGFGLVIVIHELGHFLAAKWAGIRVHEFAVGFGPAIGSWRRGMGFRRGSSAREFDALQARDGAPGMSPTEYRLNWLPLGGYVKMLGQEDMAPASLMTAPDSYQTKPVWKRMVVVSAGVVMNLLLAAALFILVFMVGLRSPAPVVGGVDPESAAGAAAPVSRTDVGPGLRAGDRILRIGGRKVRSFRDVSLASAMARGGSLLDIVVRRPGVEGDVEFRATPRESKASRLLELGIYAPASDTLGAPREGTEDLDLMLERLRRAGLERVPPGSRLLEVNGAPVEFAFALEEACERSGGSPVSVVFETPAGDRITASILPEPRLQIGSVEEGGRTVSAFPHLLGLRPAPVLGSVQPGAGARGLRVGDIIARIGTRVWPETQTLIEEAKAHAGEEVELRVLRADRYETLTVRPSREGRIGIGLPDGALPRTLAPIIVRPPDGALDLVVTPLVFTPGSRVLSVNGMSVESWADLREALREVTAEALRDGTGADVTVAVRLPLGEAPDGGPVEEIAWTIAPADVEALQELAWGSPLPEAFFEPAETVLRAKNPVGALVMGVQETHRIVMMTYLTFVRLAQGSVKVEHLKGPVGIADVGTKVIRMGFIHLLFFLAVVSANLAVINFLQLPIVDGGLFIFLLVESITKRPVSVAVQNAATALGVLLIGAVFLVVTFNDIRNLIAP